MRGINDRERSEDPRAASSTTAEGAHSRAALLTGASLLVLAALVAPCVAQAACSGANQTVSSSPSGTVFSTGGAITVPAGKAVIAGTSAPGVNAYACSVTTLTNQGSINGGSAPAGADNTAPPGVGTSRAITTLTNDGTIVGGAGPGTLERGGAGVANIFSPSSGTASITTLTNNGTIIGGQGEGSSSVGGTGLANANGSSIGSLDNSKGATIGGGAGLGGPGLGGGGAGIGNEGEISKLSNEGTISGGMGPAGGFVSNVGLYNDLGTITTLTNSGAIVGGTATAAIFNYNGRITTATNSGAVTGGSGAPGEAGGAGLSNSFISRILSLTNAKGGVISGGNGGTGAAGGAGVANSATIGTLTNQGTIVGGAGGRSVTGGAGGTGVSNSRTITTLTNSGAITGGAGAEDGGEGGVGVANASGATITTFDNAKGGVISGGAGGNGGGLAGNAFDNAGAITSFTNDGTIIENGLRLRYALDSTGSIGTLVNTGQIVGDVLIDQSKVSITGGSGPTFGSFSGGTITIRGDLKFVGGNTELADNVMVGDGIGTVTNIGILRLEAPETISGAFGQSEGGMLDFLLAGDALGQYGALTVTRLATLAGGLDISFAGGFRPKPGDSFDLLEASGGTSGVFSDLLYDGTSCSATSSDVWLCRGIGIFDLTQGGGSVDLTVLSTVPEPSTWALGVLGFLSLAGLALRRRIRSAVA